MQLRRAARHDGRRPGKRGAAALVLALCAAAPATATSAKPVVHGYVALSTAKDRVDFFDTANMTSAHGAKYAWTLTVFVPPRGLLDQAPLVRKLYTKYGFNCRKTRMWQVFVSYYDRDGNLLREDDTLHQPDEIVPASVDEKIFDAACKRRSKRDAEDVIPNENSAVAFAEGSIAGRP